MGGRWAPPEKAGVGGPVLDRKEALAAGPVVMAVVVHEGRAV
jgi:hypothetical protein